MSNKSSELTIGILSALCVALVIAIVVLLSYNPEDGARLNYSVGDNESGIENASDYGLRMAPDNAYDIVVEEDATTFYGPQ